LATRKGKHRSKARIIMLFPAFIFIFIIGWALYWIGQQKTTDKNQEKIAPKKDNVSIMVRSFEEPEKIETT
jgi:hypothetical protein